VSQPAPAPPTTARALAYTAAAWCLLFAAVSAWQVVAGPAAGQRLADYASGLAIMSVLVGVLKLAGAAVALAAVRVRPGRPGRSLVDLDIVIPAQRRRTGIEPA
jgi:hypothetical protein